MAQVLEIPPFTPTPFPSGGANLPADVPPLSHRAEGSKKVFDSLVNMYRNKRGGLLNTKGGCCPCQDDRSQPWGSGPQGRAPSLGQPDGPVKPFQQPKDPCDVTREKLARMGVTPEELNDCLRGGSSRRSTGRRRKRRSSGPKKTATTSRYYSRLGKIGSKKRSFVSSGKEPGLADVASQLASMSRPRKKKRKSRANTGAAAARSVGKYKLLSNGACYDPRTRKFVKRANCR